MVDGLVPLERLKIGESARIGRINGRLDHVHRLRELGLGDGTLVEMYQPGNPCIIRTAGSKVCIRADALLSILVKPSGGAGMPPV
jgi:Fe2+ transport system protein FeoA